MVSFGGLRDAIKYSNYGTHKTTNELQVLIFFNVLVSTYASFSSAVFTFKDEVDNPLPPIVFPNLLFTIAKSSRCVPTMGCESLKGNNKDNQHVIEIPSKDLAKHIVSELKKKKQRKFEWEVNKVY
jgi:hypothetical protein